MHLLSSCPEPRDLERFLLADLPDDEADRLLPHVLHCDACCRRARSFKAEDTLTEAMQCTRTGKATPAVTAAMEDLMNRLCERYAHEADAATALMTPRQVSSGTHTSESTEEVYDFLAPAEQPDEIGRLGPYRILKVLGLGGMGIVFKAEDRHLRRLVALKTLKPALASNPAARRRFLREAQAAASVTHDHIVTIHQVGEDRGVPFLAMQLLDGQSLEDRLRQARRGNTLLALSEVLRIGKEIAKGLDVAHRHGLIHRDIKPGNIWLETRGENARGEGTAPVAPQPSSLAPRVKILDFGLARSAYPDEFGPANETDSTASSSPVMRPPAVELALTHTGAVMGTPAYMAPEQALGESVDARCDLFSLGCVLYQMCTGRVPFQGRDSTATLRALTKEDPQPPHDINPTVPPALGDLVLCLLAKRPEDRPSSARWIAESLEQFARSQSARPKRSWSRLTVAAALLMSVVGFAVWRGTQTDDSTPRGQRSGQQAQTAAWRTCHFAPQTTYAVGPKPYAVTVGDFNGDGKPDLVVTYNGDRVAVLLNNGDGTFRPGIQLVNAGGSFGMAVGDFNGDGVPDLVVANNEASSVSLFLGKGDGTFHAPEKLATAHGPMSAAVGDFNGDGHQDLAIATGSGQVSVLLGNGDGTFQPAVHYSNPRGGISIAVADFNGDGKSDLVTSNGAADTVRILLGNGDGTFQPGIPYAVGSGPGVVVVADFNGDGHPDIAVENVGNNNVSVLLGNGDGTFQPAASYSVGANPGGLAVGDFNGDGKPDLVVANHNSGNVSVLLSNGDGTFRPAHHYAAGFTPAGVAVGDFNGDGRIDVAVANYQGGDLSVLLNQLPAPHFRLSAPYAVPAGGGMAVSITALDDGNNPDQDYTGTVRLSVSDKQAVPAHTEYTFKPEDHGVWSTGVSLKTAGAQRITVTDTQNSERVGTITVIVGGLSAKRLAVEAPTQVVAGKALRLTITALDEFGNHGWEYRGTVRVSSSDSNAQLPLDYKFVEADDGARWLPVTLKTPGKQTITVRDTGDGSLLGKVEVTVTP